MTKLETLQNELGECYKWFKYYDMQVIQYQRDLRYKGYSSIDIDKLDYEAYQKAEKIKEIRSQIAEIDATLIKQYEESILIETDDIYE